MKFQTENLNASVPNMTAILSTLKECQLKKICLLIKYSKLATLEFLLTVSMQMNGEFCGKREMAFGIRIRTF